MAVKEGAEPIAAEGSVLLHSSQLRLERGHPFRKKRGGKKGGGEREEEKSRGSLSVCLFVEVCVCARGLQKQETPLPES